MNPTGRIVFKTYHKVILFIIFLLLFTLAMLPLLINPIAASLIKNQAAALFGDKLTIGSIHVSLWTGAVIHLKGVALAQPPGYGADSLLKADSVRAKVALAPLLNYQLVIQNLSVLNPEIHLIQSQNGKLNTDYYAALLSVKQDAPTKAPQQQSLQMQRFNIQNGALTFDGYQLTKVQPTFILTGCNLALRNLELPNRSRTASPFTFTGLLGKTRPAAIRAEGTGVLGSDTLSFTAKSRVDNLFLADYGFLAPESPMTVTGGAASAVSDFRCNNNYLLSDHHVTVTGLKIKPKQDNLRGLLLGAPATLFIKAIEDRKGAFDFDFSLTGKLDDLKANLKFQVATALQKAIRSKLGLNQITTGISRGINRGVGGIRAGVQKVGKSLSQTFGKLFGEKK